uniref:Acyl-CoA-binding domain-containing protein 5 n=1 Tax=Ascaris suum TaxID=6253 RepID=F1LC62_ASCSU
MGHFRVALCARMARDDERFTIDEGFESAVSIIQNLPKEGPVKITRDQKLRFYSLFKQATIGPCNVPRPSFWNVVDVYKWDAWNSLGSMESNEAKKKYVEAFREFVDDVMNKYNFIPWLKANDDFCEKVLRPKFYILGYDWKLVEEEDGERLVDVGSGISKVPNTTLSEVANVAEDKQKSGMTLASEGSEDVPMGERKPSLVCYSDDDYIDAKDDHEHFHLLPAAAAEKSSLSESCSSSTSGSRPPDMEPKIRGSKVREAVLRRADLQISSLATHLNNVLRMLSSQHKLLVSVIHRLSPQSEGIFLSWRTFIFLFLWPILVNIIMRYFGFWKKS